MPNLPEKKQLHPNAVWYLFFNAVVNVLALGFLAFLLLWYVYVGSFLSNLLEHAKVWIFIPPLWLMGIISILSLVSSFIWAIFAYRLYRYELTETAFQKESGVINKKYVSIPYNRIQNVDIHRNIWARILGLSELRIQTAGISGVASAEGRLPGISQEEAEKLRGVLIQKASINLATF